jgi:hypothetical protein
MLTGAHVILSSTSPEADRAFLREILRLPHVDAGEGWLIFALPPAEVAIHPADADGEHELWLMCADVEAFVVEMRRAGVPCTSPTDQGWGIVVRLTLPGGGTLGVYQPRHAHPAPYAAAGKAKAQARSATKAGARGTKKSRRATDTGRATKPKPRTATGRPATPKKARGAGSARSAAGSARPASGRAKRGTKRRRP